MTAANAADAAALGAATATFPPASGGSPVAVARDLANRNGAHLVACDCGVNATLSARVASVVVAVEVDLPVFGSVTVTRTARAEFDPRLWLGR